MKLVDAILQKSGHPAYAWVVFFLTFCESVFLFIPPEVFMTPAIIADRRRAMPITIAAALGSLVGGAAAYMIGLWLFDSVGVWLIQNFASMEKFALAQDMFVRHGLFIIFLTAVTPIPYKLMAICAGFMGFPALVFLGISAIFRTARFALVGFLLWRFQEQANAIVKKYFWPLTVAAITVTAIGLCIILSL
ncbi:MAG: VTT domain-containing protein [Alphaproteobacteria bacterium]|nr:VTT domain-containing protein [Alphaproteobacteria bacterium]MDE6570866.1 VTT domain-containing protein [Alphaproteobacteria bacterium]